MAQNLPPIRSAGQAVTENGQSEIGNAQSVVSSLRDMPDDERAGALPVKPQKLPPVERDSGPYRPEGDPAASATPVGEESAAGQQGSDDSEFQRRRSSRQEQRERERMNRRATDKAKKENEKPDEEKPAPAFSMTSQASAAGGPRSSIGEAPPSPAAADVDGDGQSDDELEEMPETSNRVQRRSSGAIELRHHITRQVFRRLDPEGHGVVTKDKLRKQLQEFDDTGTYRDPRNFRCLMKAIDTNGDNCIQFEELYAWLEKSGDEWDQARQCRVFQPIDFESRENRKTRLQEMFPIREGNPSGLYDMKDSVGEGSYGAVCKATHRETKNSRAIKSILKSRVDRAELDREINVLRVVDHPNILRLFEIYEDNRFLYLVMDICTGGELFKRIVEAKTFTERQAAMVMRQIVGGVHYLHMNFICHRDLKPENFLLKEVVPIEECNIKIIDFGTAQVFKVNEKMTERVGTPYYVAPEVLRGSYNHVCDVWSCGVIMFILLSGQPPFNGAGVEDITARVLEGKYEFKPEIWGDVSEDAKELVRSMFEMDFEERCSASFVASHTWIKDNAPQAKDQPLQAAQLATMQKFCGQNGLKKQALNIIAHGISEEQIQQLQEMFKSLDKNGDGQITFQELAAGCQHLDQPSLIGDLQTAMEAMDVDGSGTVNYTEFLAATLDVKKHAEEKVCWEAFRIFDKDGSGTISKKELAVVLSDSEVNKAINSSKIDKIMSDCDQDGDGEITFEEFMTMMAA